MDSSNQFAVTALLFVFAFAIGFQNLVLVGGEQQLKANCSYVVTIETSCTRDAGTLNHISLRFGDSSSNDVTIHTLNTRRVRWVDPLQPDALNDVPRKPFQPCSVDQFQVDASFSDVPINPNVQFDFILSFGIDYTSTTPPSPTNGNFNIFWDTANLSPSQVSLIKHKHKNVRVALSVGGDSVFNNPAYFDPSSVQSWVSNAFTSLRKIILQYNLDGIDIDYEHFKADPSTFAECIGQLITRLKREKLITFASIAPFDDADVQSHYIALWKSYGHVIDYVNFQFYAYDNTTTIPEFIKYYEEQTRNYKGGKILTSFISDGSKGLPPATTFFPACRILKKRRQLYGIFVWCADESKSLGFRYEKESQSLLAARY